MTLLRIKNGYDLNISGAPTEALEVLASPERVAVLPAKIPFIKPKPTVAAGDAVRRGSVLFVDKRNPRIRFLSPGGGRVADIRFGPRRAIEAIVVVLSPTESEESFLVMSDADVEAISRAELIQYLLDGGLWPMLRALPFRDIADPDPNLRPPAIIVDLGAQEPFLPQPSVYLDAQTQLFDRGLALLRRLCDRVVVYGPQTMKAGQNGIGSRVTHTYRGGYPASDPGVMVYHTRTGPEDNRSWYICGQDLLAMARLTVAGRYPVERIVAVGGSESPVRCHVKTRLGVPLAHLIGGALPAGARPVVGGVFRGYGSDPDGYLGFYETSLALLPEGPDEEFLGFVRPGYGRASYSRTFLSAANPAPLFMDCNFHGEERACVACSACNRVCPVEMLPQLAFKSVLTGEIEEVLAYGLLDCVECGLCTYVCPSKIDLCAIFKSAKRDYHKEQVAP
ncbi:MAG: 4Fe-4S dicluster domain-containing protein [Desulfobacterales bacterium]|nr:4Fe-4S dicluster domain-containing protein [Desulfobacterales bacterium]